MTLRILAGATTGCLAVLVAQPTDVVKIRMQADMSSRGARRYTGSISAYRNIGKHEGIKGLWKGTLGAFVYLFVARRESAEWLLLRLCPKSLASWQGSTHDILSASAV